MENAFYFISCSTRAAIKIMQAKETRTEKWMSACAQATPLTSRQQVQRLVSVGVRIIPQRPHLSPGKESYIVRWSVKISKIRVLPPVEPSFYLLPGGRRKFIERKFAESESEECNHPALKISWRIALAFISTALSCASRDSLWFTKTLKYCGYWLIIKKLLIFCPHVADWKFSFFKLQV